MRERDRERKFYKSTKRAKRGKRERDKKWVKRDKLKRRIISTK